MAHYVWDIEGNGLHEITLDQKGQPTPECSKVHCLVAINCQTQEMHTFRPHQIDEGGTSCVPPNQSSATTSCSTTSP